MKSADLIDEMFDSTVAEPGTETETETETETPAKPAPREKPAPSTPSNPFRRRHVNPGEEPAPKALCVRESARTVSRAAYLIDRLT